MAPTQQECSAAAAVIHKGTCKSRFNTVSCKNRKENSNISTSSSSSRKSYSSSSSNSSSYCSTSSTSNNKISVNNKNILRQPTLESTTDMDTFLPVATRGLFYHDSFFEEAREQFDSAVREVLNNWGEDDRSALEDDITTYRKLRKVNLTEDSQAVTVSEKDTHHQVVLDVRDFQSGDVKVKVVDENELVVEGSVEQREGTSTSTKTFRRGFTFPGLVRPEAITSTMSSDGVLTIIVPRKAHKERKQEVKDEKVKTKGIHSSDDTEPKFPDHFSSNTNAKTKSFTSSDKNNTDEMLTEKKVHFRETDNINTSSEKTSEHLLKSSKDTTSTKLPEESSDLLPIVCKGNFFNDSYFAQVRQDFEAAMKEVLKSYGETVDVDTTQRYRSLRERDLTEENQAVSLTEDSAQHKVVLDVRDFQGGDVKVKMVDENELEVEGSVEQRKGTSTSTKTFRRGFTFPGLVRPEAVTSTMSSDGVLTIIVPKKVHNERKQEVKSECVKTKGIHSSDDTEPRSPDHSSRKTNTKTKSFTSSYTQNRDEKSTEKKVQFRETDNINTSSEKTSEHLLKSSKDTTSTKLPEESSDLLPIVCKGNFFHDSYFAQVRQDFEAAMKEVLKSYGETVDVDTMQRYRSLRERDLTEENQAVSLTEDSAQHKVVLDVRDFQDGDVEVKMVDENELVVEGSMEQREGTLTSTKTFRRGFTFPGLVKPKAVTSIMSSDGVLTIIVPKKELSQKLKVHSDDKWSTNIRESSSTSSEKSASSKSDSATTSKDRVMFGRKTSKCSSSTSTGTYRDCSAQQTRDEGATRVVEEDPLSSTATVGSDASLPIGSQLPLSQKGLFFHDSFFQNARQDFETAVREVLKRFGQSGSSNDDLSAYRSLRQCDLRDESQAMKVTWNNDNHQVVMDVRDFMMGDIKVKMVGENEVQVEGVKEEEEGGKKSCKRFSRRVQLACPGVINAEAVTAALSSDGVLTITAPQMKRN